MQFLGLPLRSFVTGLVSTAISALTNVWVNQVVDIVGAAVPYVNVDGVLATIIRPVNAEFSFGLTLSHSRMMFTQPDGKRCTTSVPQWTCGHHFCSRVSLEAIPVIECVVTFGVCCYVVMFSCSVCQKLVILTFIG